MIKQMENRMIWIFAVMITTAAAEPVPRFASNDSVWNQSVVDSPVHPESVTMINTVSNLGGFGFGRMQIDFGLHVVRADPGSPVRQIIEHPNGYFLPDCESPGTAMPVPDDAAIEAQSGLSCPNTEEDCHLLVVQENLLYEAFAATAGGAGELQAQCLAVWNLDADYPPEGRGDHCTSADAAGFPIAPLLFNADEIAESLDTSPDGSGNIGHAIRFILPNDRMASDVSLGGVQGRLYVRPASHAGGPSGPVNAIAYGSRLRLRSNFPVADYPPAARVILNTLKEFGMVLSDGGRVALTAESDLYTETLWEDLGIDSRIFDLTEGATDVSITDFEVLDTGDRIAETYECVRSVIVDDVLFADGFETG